MSTLSTHHADYQWGHTIDGLYLSTRTAIEKQEFKLAESLLLKLQDLLRASGGTQSPSPLQLQFATMLADVRSKLNSDPFCADCGASHPQCKVH